jgi:tetratricopeptide (TPR) repeat protein
MHDESNPHVVRRWNFWFIGGFLALIVLALGGLHALHRYQESRLQVDHREAAFRYYEQGDYKAALGHLGHVLQSAPNDLEAVRAFARSVGELPDPTPQQQLGQLAQYRRAIMLEPSDAKTAAEGLELFLEFDLWLEASEMARQVLAVDETSKPALLALAQVAMHEDRGADAEELLMRVRGLYPSDDESLDMLVRLLERRAANQPVTQRGETIQRLETLVQEAVEGHGETNPRLYLIRARRLERAGDEASLALARADYERVLDLLPRQADVATLAGRFYRRAGEFEEAVRWLNIALEVDPQSHETYALLAQTYSDRGRYGDAERILKQALEACPREATLLRFYLAETLLFAGETQRVREIIDELTDVEVPVALTRYLQARLHLLEGRPAEAVNIFETIADPVVTPMAQFFLTKAYMQLGQPQRALARLAQVPGNQFDPLMLGRLQLDVLAANGMYRDVIRKAEEMIAEYPNDADLLFLKADGLMGLLLSGQGMTMHLQELSRLHERLLQVATDDVRVRLLKSRIEQLAGRRDQAQYDLEEALSEQPAALELYAELVRLHLQDDDVEEALRILELAPPEVTNRPLYRVLVARTHAVGGDLDRAVSLLTRGLEEYSVEDRLSLQRLAATMLQRADRGAEAIDVLVEAADQNPQNIDLRVALLAMSDVQRQTELRDRLIAEIRRAEEAQGPDDPAVVWRVEQGRAHLLDPQQAEPEEALNLLSEVLEVQPKNEKALHLLALAHRQLEQLDEAIDAARRALRVQPDQQITKLLLVDLLGRADRHEEAGALIDELSELQGPQPLLLVQDRLSWSLRKGETASALEDARTLVASDPANPRLRVLLARLLFADEQPRQALDEAQQGLRLAPGFLDAAMTVVEIALAQDRIEVAEQAVAQFAEHTDQPEAPYLLRSDILADQGDAEGVLDVLQEGIDATRSPALMLARARELARQERAEEALAQYDRIPSNADVAAAAALEAAELMLRQGAEEQRITAKIDLAERVGAPRLDVLALRWLRLGLRRPPGWVDEALPILQEMTTLEGAGPDVFLDLAQVQLNRGALQASAEALDEGLSRFPDHLGLNEEMGKLYVRLGQLDQARIKAAYIASLPEGEAPAKLLQIDVYEAQQNYQPAIVQLKNMLRTNPDDPRARQWRLRALSLLERMGDEDGLERLLEETPVAERDDALHERWAVHLLRTQGPTAAAAYLKQRLEENPQSPELHFVLARVLLSQPAEERDAELFDASLAKDEALNPGTARGLLLRAAAAREREDFDEAVEIYRQALEREPGNPIAVNNLAWTLGSDLNRTGEALRLLEEGLSRHPADPSLRRSYGILLVDARRWEEALSVWQSLARDRRADINAKLRVAQAHLELGQSMQARQVVNEVRDLITVLRNGVDDLDADTRDLYSQVQRQIVSLGN